MEGMAVVGNLMIKSIFRYLFIFISSCIFFSCSNNSPKKTEIVQKKKIEVPKFNADSAYHFVEKQVSFGPRVISSIAWKKCALWLEQKMRDYTTNVIVQEAPITTYDGKNHTLKNIIASFSPNKNNRIALFAHWDSRHIADHDTKNQDSPILGANDGGSGVGVLLELARHFSNKSPNIGIDIILFDAEDYGQPENSEFPIMQDSWCLGSQYWSKNPHKENYFARYGVLLDMVGAENATFRHEHISSYFAPNVLQKIWTKAHQLGFGNHFIFENAKQIIDDHYYVNTITGIPTIDIIEYDPATETNFNKHWHTHKDDMQNINKNTLNAVGQTLLEVIYNE
jgi:hypothetical protein